MSIPVYQYGNSSGYVNTLKNDELNIVDIVEKLINFSRNKSFAKVMTICPMFSPGIRRMEKNI